jgi:hypothetical protein
MKEYYITHAKKTDAQALAALANQAILGYPFESIYDPEQLMLAIEQGEYRVVAKHLHLGLVGTAILAINNSLMAEIARVAVLPQFRQNGAARSLTTSLAEIARLGGLHPFADVRADQIGMQRSAQAAGLTAYSIEPGKHVVYSHQGQDLEELGPARESMVHMSSLNIGLDSLQASLDELSTYTRQQLAHNMHSALTPLPKNTAQTSTILPSAKEVKSKIGDRLRIITPLNSEEDYPDIYSISTGNSSLVIILPDTSAFLTNPSPDSILEMQSLATHLGLQVLTTYVPTSNTHLIDALVAQNMHPVMVRPWQENSQQVPCWQIGLQHRMNGFEDCQHLIHLDQQVEKSILQIISVVAV